MSNEDNVVYLDMLTRLDTSPDRVLSGAMGELDDVLVIGVKKDGGLYIRASENDPKNMSWLMDMAKYKIMQIVYDD